MAKVARYASSGESLMTLITTARDNLSPKFMPTVRKATSFLHRLLSVRRTVIDCLPTDGGSTKERRFGPRSEELTLSEGWTIFVVRSVPIKGPAACSLTFSDREQGIQYPPVFLAAADKEKRLRARPAFRMISNPVKNLCVTVFGANAEISRVRLVVWQVGRLGFGLYLLFWAPSLLFTILRASSTSDRLRVAYLAHSSREPISYETWLALFERKSFVSEQEIVGFRSGVEFGVLIKCNRKAPQLLANSMASLERQSLQPLCIEIAESTDHSFADALDRLREDQRVTHIGVIESGDRLAADAFVKAGAALATSDVDLLYADHDFFDECTQRRQSPCFKPSWDPQSTVLSDLIRGFTVVRKQNLDFAVGAIRMGSPWPYVLKHVLMQHRSLKVLHLPQVLCHCSIEARISTKGGGHASTLESLPLVDEETGEGMLSNSPSQSRTTSLVIACACRPGVADRLVPRVVANTSTRSGDFVIAVHERNLAHHQTRAFLANLAKDRRVRILSHAVEPFNFSMICNLGARASRSEFICFLNDDIDVIEPRWLDRLVSMMNDRTIGAVSARLLYPNGTIQHAGVVIGLMGAAEHWNRFAQYADPKECERTIAGKEVSAVTGACLLVRRSAFDAIGGFDEQFAIGFNDIDFCLRLRQAGWRIVLVRDVNLVHYESASLTGLQGKNRNVDRERGLFRARWQHLLHADPYFNPNLSLATTTPELAVPPRDRAPRLYRIRADASRTVCSNELSMMFDQPAGSAPQ